MIDKPSPIVVDLLAADFHFRAHDIYDELRAHSPVALVGLPHQPGREFWMITGYAAAETALRDSRLANSSPAARAARQSAGRQSAAPGGTSQPAGFPPNMLLSDPPEHTRLRRIAQQAFTPRLVAALRPSMVDRAERLLDAADGAARAADGTVDLLHAYAYPLSLAVIGDILGFPAAWHADLQALAVRAATESTPLLAPESTLQSRLESYARDLIVLKRGDPADDLVSHLVHPDSAADRLSDAELMAMIGLLTAAGFETSASLIGCATLALASSPAQWDALRDDPELAGAAVEEAMRYWGPVESATMRYAVEPLALAGQRIAAGDRVLVCLAAANHDPAHVADPHRFDINRKPSGHLGFSGGIHTCLGAALARAEVRIALTALVRRWPKLRLAADAGSPRWRPGAGLRGLSHLPVRPPPVRVP